MAARGLTGLLCVLLLPLSERQSSVPWTIASKPQIVIAVGSDSVPLNGVLGLTRLSDGRIVVVDDRMSLQVYDRLGRFLRSFGRRGRGPEEFSNILRFCRGAGDSLIVYDDASGIVTVVGPDLRVARTIAGARRWGPAILAHSSSGEMIAGPLTTSYDQVSPVIRRESFEVQRLKPGGATLTVVAGLVQESYFDARPGMIAAAPLPLAMQLGVAASSERIYVADRPDYLISVFDTAGASLGILVRGATARRATENDFRAFVESNVRQVANDAARSARRRRLEQMPHSSRIPTIASIKLDALGHLWVQSYSPRSSEPSSWRIFDRGGKELGSLTLPIGFQLFEAGPDYVLGVQPSERSGEQVMLYQVARKRS